MPHKARKLQSKRVVVRSPTTGADFPDLLAYWALLEARADDPRRLRRRLLAGVPLSTDERKLVADLITGKVKPRRPKPGAKSAREKDEIVQTILYVEATHPGRKREAIVKGVCEVFGVSRRQAFKLLSEIDPSRRQAIEAGAAMFAELGYTVECTKPRS
jgi:hypothetical protein